MYYDILKTILALVLKQKTELKENHVNAGWL